jgi:uracil-DNA glycosylase
VPSRAEQKLCRPFLEQEITLIKPLLIIPIGGLAIKLFFPADAKLRDVIGRGLFIREAVWRTASPFDCRLAQPVEALRPDDNGGRYIIPLPHPSGASLWPNRPANRALIEHAINLLAAIRAQWQL